MWTNRIFYFFYFTASWASWQQLKASIGGPKVSRDAPWFLIKLLPKSFGCRAKIPFQQEKPSVPFFVLVLGHFHICSSLHLIQTTGKTPPKQTRQVVAVFSRCGSFSRHTEMNQNAASQVTWEHHSLSRCVLESFFFFFPGSSPPHESKCRRLSSSSNAQHGWLRQLV